MTDTNDTYTEDDIREALDKNFAHLSEWQDLVEGVITELKRPKWQPQVERLHGWIQSTHEMPIELREDLLATIDLIEQQKTKISKLDKECGHWMEMDRKNQQRIAELDKE